MKEKINFLINEKVRESLLIWMLQIIEKFDPYQKISIKPSYVLVFLMSYIGMIFVRKVQVCLINSMLGILNELID